MITAKNYAAQCEKNIRDRLHLLRYQEDIPRIKEYFLDLIPKAVHFAVPDTGLIFDGTFKGIIDKEIRLPFPCITTEYYIDQNEEDLLNKDGKTRSSKRVCVAREVTTKELRNIQNHSLLDDYEEDDIWIIFFSASFFDSYLLWGVDPVGYAIPSKWLRDAGSEKDDSLSYLVNGYAIPLCGKMMIDIYELEGEDAVQQILEDCGSEAKSILSLCEALSCSNVSHRAIDVVDSKVNEKRIRKGKVPFYETRVLWVDTPHVIKQSGEHQGGTHRSPRQHLRRGHIRRLMSGKNVWVNAAVVGSKLNGFIDKEYAMKQAAK